MGCIFPHALASPSMSLSAQTVSRGTALPLTHEFLMLRTEHAKTFDMKSDSIYHHEGEQPPSTHSTFLSRKPPFSKTQVNKQGSQWRDGEKFNSDVLSDTSNFMDHSATK